VAAREFAHLLWLTDFSDRDKAPDFNVAPLFQHPHNPEVAASLTRSADEYLADGRLREAVRGISAPVLVLHGEDDPLPVEGAIDLAERLPHAQLVIVKGVGHTLWLEDPSAVERALRQFVGSEVPEVTAAKG
jgi:proline iminopeptidase